MGGATVMQGKVSKKRDCKRGEVRMGKWREGFLREKLHKNSGGILYGEFFREGNTKQKSQDVKDR